MSNLKEYYKTKHWTKLSKKLLEDKEVTCALCGRKRYNKYVRKEGYKRVLKFAIHHLRYDNIYHEEEHPEDILILCCNCHNLAHDLFRCKNISPMYAELWAIAEKYGFKFEKGRWFLYSDLDMRNGERPKPKQKPIVKVFDQVKP